MIAKPTEPAAQATPGSDNTNEASTKVDQRAFRDGYEPAEGDVFIAVLGVTGAGKSTFISKCTEKEVSIGHNLQACTQEVGVFLCKSREFNIYVIDTPGFDDTDRSDTEVRTHQYQAYVISGWNQPGQSRTAHCGV